jgi:formate hydrogenlyase transcriptional activator
MKNQIVDNEVERLQELQRYAVLDSLPEEDFDELVKLAAQVCGTPIALISLVDDKRQWFKAAVGLAARETPREYSFCARAISQSDLFVIPDTQADERFSNNPLVTSEPRIRFYAGAPLVTPAGYSLGTLCVIDRAPRQLNSLQADALRTLAREVMAQLELRRTNREQGAAQEALRESEEFKTRLIDGSQDCIKVLDLEGRLLSMNAGGMKTLEICDFGPVCGAPWAEFWQGKDRECCEGALAKARQGQVGRFTGFFPTTQSRKPMWFDVVVSAILDKSGRPEKILAVSRDVTESKRADDLLRAIIEGTAASTGTEFFRSLVRHVAEGLRVRFAFVAECLPNLRARSLGFWIDGKFGDDFEYDLPGTPCMEVAKGRTCHVPDRLPDVFPEDKGMIELGTVSYLGVPLWDSQRRTIGHLVVFHDEPLLEDPLALSVMETFAARAGAELERVQAERLLRAIIDGTSTVTGQEFFLSLVKHAALALRVQTSFVAECLPNNRARALAAWSGSDFRPSFEYDLTGTPCEGVIDGRTCKYERDLGAHFPQNDYIRQMGIESYVGVPLRDSTGKVIGHLVVTDTKPWQADPYGLPLLETFAARAGAELEREHAAAELRKAAERRRTLLEVTNAIIKHLKQEELLRATCEALRRVTPFDRAAFTLYQPQSDGLRILAIEGKFQSEHFQVGKEIPRKDSHSGWAFDHQRPLLRRDLTKEAVFASERILVQEGVRSICTTPLIVGGKSIGTMNLASYTALQYSETDAELLHEVASQVAVAIANMRAYEEIAALKARLQAENTYLQEEIRAEHNFTEIVGNSPKLRAVLQQVELVAPTDSTVLILGETGTGKELIARAIHDRSQRKNHPLVKVNCGAISAGLVESELFGHVKGAFTGALSNRDGRFKLADGGTIFLDEVGELPPETQVKLLRVLQEQEFEPVGSSKSIRVNVRVIAATNRNLEDAVREGKFRRDLFYRLNVLPMHLPPLRERSDDVPLLAAFFVQAFARRFGKSITQISEGGVRRLVAYDWPGNIRELQNVIERAVVLSIGTVLDLPPDFQPVVVKEEVSRYCPPNASLDVQTPGRETPAEPASSGSLEEIERQHIQSVLAQTHWMIEGERGAARILNLHPSTLRSRMQKLGIKRPSRS